jgi:hypothetical protein
MRPLGETRKYEVLMPDGSWEPVHWEQLDEGDTVRDLDAGVHKYMPNPFVIDEQPALMVLPLGKRQEITGE